jgi:hypothetical protein
LQSRTPSNRKASFGLCCWTGLIFLHACIALRSFTISFFCVRSFRQIYWTVYHMNNSSPSSSTPLCNLDNNLEKNYVWKRLYWSGISQGYQTTRGVVCSLALCLCTLLMMLLIECMGCAGCTLQKAAEGDILRSHTQILIWQNSAERAHTKTHLQTVIWFCV